MDALQVLMEGINSLFGSGSFLCSFTPPSSSFPSHFQSFFWLLLLRSSLAVQRFSAFSSKLCRRRVSFVAGGGLPVARGWNCETSLNCSHKMDDECAIFVKRMNPPRVEIDDQSCKNATVIQITLQSSWFESLVSCMLLFVGLRAFSPPVSSPSQLVESLGKGSKFKAINFSSLDCFLLLEFRTITFLGL